MVRQARRYGVTFIEEANWCEKAERHSTMYTLEIAAKMLGVSKWTIRRWIAQDNIKVQLIETDRKRICLTYEDLLALSDKHGPIKEVDKAELQEYTPPNLTGLYSIQDVARILGVAERTVSRWMKETKIERREIMTDRKRVYLSYTDILTLANQYNRLIAYTSAKPEPEQVAQDEGPIQETQLYTVAEAALFLGVAEKTLRAWLLLYNVEKKTVETDKKHFYITYSDVIMLANKHKRDSVYPVNIAADIREIRNRLERIEAGIINLEKYIKRSIFIGK